tara:strand:+ start:322 stop:972 length:651 start_codon:yes stop_codon:yes gene_type:complete
LENFISNLIKSSPIHNQPFFISLLSGTMDKDSFKETQIAILNAVEFFSRPMFVISSKLNSYEDRYCIIKNILDEHGNGQIEKAHGNTFKQYLVSLGATEKQINNRKPDKAVLKFNNILLECSLNSSIMKSIAMMGIIEQRYSKISDTIVKEILKKRWISKDSLYHYSLHKELDVEHAQDFYNIIKDGWKDTDSKEEIKKGLFLGNSMILNLYNDIL